MFNSVINKKIVGEKLLNLLSIENKNQYFINKVWKILKYQIKVYTIRLKFEK